MLPPSLPQKQRFRSSTLANTAVNNLPSLNLLINDDKNNDKSNDNFNCKNLSCFIREFMTYMIENYCSCIQTDCLINELRDDTFNVQFLELIEKIALTKLNNCNRSNGLSIDISNYNNSMNSVNSVDNLPFINKIQNIFEHKPDKLKLLNVMNYFISQFIVFGFLSLDHNKFYLFDTEIKNRLSWFNIQNLDITDLKEYKKKHSNYYYELQTWISNSPTKKLQFIRRTSINHQHNDITLSVLQLIKYLLWFFRKFIIDSIIILVNQPNVIPISVGSTKLSSDYDITLYGHHKKITKVIQGFDNIIESIFQDTSSKLFDTNIYGISFIILNQQRPLTPNQSRNNVDSISRRRQSIKAPIVESSPIVLLDKLKQHYGNAFQCGKTQLLVLNSSDDSIASQHVWAFVKLLNNMSIIQQCNEAFYIYLIKTLRMLINSPILNYAFRIINVLNIEDSEYETGYVNIIDNLENYYNKFAELNGFNLNTVMNNFISLVNYHGNETYYTRGAFLDVVVNQQLCKQGETETFKLTLDNYIDSFIENMADIISYPKKKKYVDRSKKALDMISNFIPDSSTNIITQLEFIMGDLDYIEQQQNDYKIEMFNDKAIQTIVIKDISSVFNLFIQSNKHIDIEKDLTILDEILKRIPELYHINSSQSLHTIF